MKYLVGILIAGLLAAAYFSWLSKAERPAPPAGRTAPLIQTERIEEETSTYRIKVRYPRIAELGDSAAESASNRIIRNSVEENVRQFREDAQTATAGDSDIKSEMTMDFQVVRAEKDFTSIRLDQYYFVAGAAHGLPLVTGFNYDFSRRRRLQLADLFRGNSIYLETLSRLAREQLVENLGEYYDEDFAAGGTEPKAENFAEFLLPADQLKIIFNVYQVAPYVAGSQEINIPYADLRELWNPELSFGPTPI